MAQTILNFTLESTNEKLTPRTGVAVFGEYLKGMGFENLCNTHIPNSSHHNAYNPFEFIYPLILMLHSGGRVLDDIKEIRMDEALEDPTKNKEDPHSRCPDQISPQARIGWRTRYQKYQQELSQTIP